MPYPQADADMAAKRVRDSRARIDRLKQEIEEAKRAGRDTQADDRMLETFETTLGLILQSQQEIERELRRKSGAPPSRSAGYSPFARMLL